MDMNREEALALYRTMLLIRRFEERCAQLYVEGKIGGFLHLYIGQEAVGRGGDEPAASRRLLRHLLPRPRSRPRARHRSSAADGRAVRQGHRDQPRQGRQHALLRRPARQLRRATASWAATCPWPRAWATASACAGTDQVVLCFFGDGAVNEGAFHEALNVSALWDLPVVYIIENNRYGMGTSLDRASSVKDLYQRGSAYGIPRRDVNGMDLMAVRNVLGEAIDRARKEKRPTLIEAETYRYRGHSMSDPGKYRTKEEVEEMMQFDPIHALRQAAHGAGAVHPGRARRHRQGRPGPDRRVGALRGGEPASRRRNRCTRTSTCARPTST